MAVALGKRKRPEPPKNKPKAKSNESDQDDDDDDVRARFQRAFEAKFKPLATAKVPVKVEIEEDESESEDGEEEGDEGWSGIEEESDAVEIIEHGPQEQFDRDEERRQMKAFMTSKPPTSKESSAQNKKPVTAKQAEEEAGESANLKHDLALQRLLKESHLLNPATFGTRTNEPEGKSRLKALDLRLEDLGAKKGLMAQQKMPLAHLRGIRTKATSRESKRRKEAAENGIILEKAKSKASDKPAKRRERGVDGPGVGKFRGGTLTLSKKDVRSIEGPKKSSFGKGKRR